MATTNLNFKVAHLTQQEKPFTDVHLITGFGFVFLVFFAAVEEICPENMNLLRLLVFQKEHLFKDLRTLRETSIVNLKARHDEHWVL